MYHSVAGIHIIHSQPHLTPQPVELIWFIQPHEPYIMGSCVYPYGLCMYCIHALSTVHILFNSLLDSYGTESSTDLLHRATPG